MLFRSQLLDIMERREASSSHADEDGHAGRGVRSASHWEWRREGKEAALLGKRERKARASSGTRSYRWGSAIRRESSGSMEIGWWQRGSYRDDVKGGRQPGAGLA